MTRPTQGRVRTIMPKIKHLEDKTRGPMVCLVGPYGQVKTLEVKPNVGGDVFVQWNSSLQQPEIPKRYREKGWVFYDEVCDGREDRTGTGADKGAKYKRMMDLLMEARQKGQRPLSGTLDTDKLYHPEVLRRRSLERVDDARPVELESILGELAADVKATPKPKPAAKRKGGKGAPRV